MASLPDSPASWLVFTWGVGGVCLILTSAVLRLSPMAMEAVQGGLTGGQWVAAGLWSAFMIYSEGYRGFHRQFSPRVVVRGLALARDPRPLPVVLAPFTCMGLLHATRKRKIVAWSVLSVIVLLIVGVRQLDQPWRGIIDLGVVLGLSTGLASLVGFTVRAVAGHPPDVPSDMP